MKKAAIVFFFIVAFYPQELVAVYKKATLQKLSWFINIETITAISDLESLPYCKLRFIFTRLCKILKPSKNPFSRYAVLEKNDLLEAAYYLKDKIYAEIIKRQTSKNSYYWVDNNNEHEDQNDLEQKTLSIRSIARSIGIKTVQSFSDLCTIRFGELIGLINFLTTCIKRDNYYLKNHATRKADQEMLITTINFYEKFLTAAQEELTIRNESGSLGISEDVTDKEDFSDDEIFLNNDEENESSIGEQLIKAYNHQQMNAVISHLNHVITKQKSCLSPTAVKGLDSLTAHIESLKLGFSKKNVPLDHTQTNCQ